MKNARARLGFHSACSGPRSMPGMAVCSRRFSTGVAMKLAGWWSARLGRAEVGGLARAGAGGQFVAGKVPAIVQLVSGAAAGVEHRIRRPTLTQLTFRDLH